MVGPCWTDWGYLQDEMDHEEWTIFFASLSADDQARYQNETIITVDNWDEFWKNFDEEKFIDRGIRVYGYTREQIVEMIDYARAIKPLSEEEFERRADEVLESLRNDTEFQEKLRKRLEERRNNRPNP